MKFQPEHLAESMERALPPDFTMDPWQINQDQLVFRSMIHYERHGKRKSIPIQFDYWELRMHMDGLVEYVCREIRKKCMALYDPA